MSAKKTSATAKSASAEPTFEDSLGELEQIVAALESGELSLEAAMQRYERGVTLLKNCLTQLQAAESRIGQLTDDATITPMAESSGDLTKKATTRSRRRSTS